MGQRAHLLQHIVTDALVHFDESDGVAALPEGRNPAIGVTTGALAPLLPVLGAMAAKKAPTGGTATLLGLTSAGAVAWAFLQGRKASQEAA